MNLQLQVSKDRLDRTLGILKHALDRRVTLPILQHILVDIRPKEVVLKATDMELAFEATVPGEGQGQWTMAVPGKKFIETVRVFPEGILSLECPEAGGRLWLRAKGMNSEHNIQPGEGFPELPAPAKELPVVRIPVLRFKRAIQLGSIAVSKDATKPTLSAVLVHLSKHHVRVVSTDGFRLAVAEVPCDTKLKDEVRLIVPKRALDLIPTLLGDEGEVELCWDGTTLYLDQPGLKFSTRLVTGNYPAYEKVLPAELPLAPVAAARAGPGPTGSPAPSPPPPAPTPRNWPPTGRPLRKRSAWGPRSSWPTIPMRIASGSWRSATGPGS